MYTLKIFFFEICHLLVYVCFFVNCLSTFKRDWSFPGGDSECEEEFDGRENLHCWLRKGKGAHRKEWQWPLGAYSGLQLPANKEKGTLAYSCKELNLVNTYMTLEENPKFQITTGLLVP